MAATRREDRQGRRYTIGARVNRGVVFAVPTMNSPFRRLEPGEHIMKKKKLKKNLRKRLRKLVSRHGPEVAAILLTGFVSDLATSRKPRHRAGDAPDHPHA